MSQINTNAILDASGGTTTTINGLTPTVSNMAGRNLIINGDMRIAQRATSSSPTSGGYFTVDRWRFGQASSYAASLTPTINQSSTAPAGFTNSFLYTNGTGAAPTSSQLISIDQYIEGLNCADLDFGASTATTVTISFWVRASVTGTYAVALTNDSINRSYVTTYTISSANTWEQKSVTIAGDTSGTWLKTNGTGIVVRFPIGAGSNLQTTANAWQAGNYYTTSACTNLTATSGATFYITGVQLEAGSVATPFEHRQYGQELALCQRYYAKLNDPTGVASTLGTVQIEGSTNSNGTAPFSMRAAPSASFSGLTISDSSVIPAVTSVIALASLSGAVSFTVACSAGTLTSGRAGRIRIAGSATAYLAFSAEL